MNGQIEGIKQSPRQELINSQHALDEEYKYNFDSFCTFVFKDLKGEF